MRTLSEVPAPATELVCTSFYGWPQSDYYELEK